MYKPKISTCKLKFYEFGNLCTTWSIYNISRKANVNVQIVMQWMRGFSLKECINMPHMIHFVHVIQERSGGSNITRLGANLLHSSFWNLMFKQ